MIGVVDTSVIVAILESEDEADYFLQQIAAADRLVMSAATFVELNAVMKHRKGEKAFPLIDAFLNMAKIDLEPLTEGQAHLAREAYAKYSSLNFGDCFAYALAMELDAPLLFKGDDFAKTDVKQWKG